MRFLRQPPTQTKIYYNTFPMDHNETYLSVRHLTKLQSTRVCNVHDDSQGELSLHVTSKHEIVKAIRSVSRAHAYKMISGTQLWTWDAACELFQCLDDLKAKQNPTVRRVPYQSAIDQTPYWQREMNEGLAGEWLSFLDGHSIWRFHNHSAEKFHGELLKHERGAREAATVMFGALDPIMI